MFVVDSVPTSDTSVTTEMTVESVTSAVRPVPLVTNSMLLFNLA